jgi:tetratricopeptide (TPR) repeat protein
MTLGGAEWAQQQPVAASLQAARGAMAAGLAASHSGDLAAARREFARAVRLAPRVSATHAALGSILLEQNEVPDALHELGLAHSLDPADVSNNLNLARAQVAAGHFDVAVSLFQQVLHTAQPPALSDEEALAYATALAGIHQAAAADDALRTALARSPDSAMLNDALGTLLAQAGQLDQAMPFFQRAVVSDPALAQAQYHLGVALLESDRAPEALAPLQLAASARPGQFDYQLQLGRALSALHRDGEAVAALHRAMALRSASTPSRSVYALALALQASGDPQSARTLFEVALTDPAIADSSALINEALAHVQTGDASGALPLYSRALKLGPDTPTLREDFGVAYLQQSKLDEAMEQFRAGIALQPENAHLHYDLGLALKLKDDLTGAVAEFGRSAQLDPTLPDPPYTLGVIYMQQGKFADAAAQLKNVTALQPENGDAWALLGSVLKDSGDSQGATDALRRAITLEPDQPGLHIQLAALDSQAGDKDGAAAERKIAADLSRAAISRQRASFALKSARTLLSEDKVPEAIVQLTVAVQADPKLAEPHSLLADAYTRQHKPADAALERRLAAALTNP